MNVSVRNTKGVDVELHLLTSVFLLVFLFPTLALGGEVKYEEIRSLAIIIGANVIVVIDNYLEPF